MHANEESQSILVAFPSSTLPKQERMKKVSKQRVNDLIDEHFTNLLREAGLHDVYTTMLNPPTTEPLSRFPKISATAVRRALHTFFLFLESSSSIISSPRLSSLTSASTSYLSTDIHSPAEREKSSESLAHHIHKKALGKLTKAYEMICEIVRKPGSEYDAGETLLGSERPFGRGDLVRAVFGIPEQEEDDSEGGESDSEDDDEGEGAEEDTRTS
ncbi:hypothetical protein NMY22_g11364 [Coprinellus aureogranulatus]|nr:hypothetical protein NMY22_g11364 [Coprinellus aureogranulatus]